MDNLQYKDETQNMAKVSLQKGNYDPSAELVK